MVRSSSLREPRIRSIQFRILDEKPPFSRLVAREQFLGIHTSEIFEKRNQTMAASTIIQKLGQFFPGAFKEGSGFLGNPDGQRIFDRISKITTEPLHLTNFNQLIHLVHEAGVSQGFFKYYFLSIPNRHPYPLNKMQVQIPTLGEKGISSIEQAEWGFLTRIIHDAA